MHLWRNQRYQCQICFTVLVLWMIILVNRTASVWNTKHWIRGSEGGATDDIRHFRYCCFPLPLRLRLPIMTLRTLLFASLIFTTPHVTPALRSFWIPGRSGRANSRDRSVDAGSRKNALRTFHLGTEGCAEAALSFDPVGTCHLTRVGPCIFTACEAHASSYAAHLSAPASPNHRHPPVSS